MRRLLLPALLFVGVANAAPALVAHTNAFSNATQTTPGVDTTGASLLVIGAADYFTDITTCTVTDSNSNTWHHLSNQPGDTNTETALWYAWDKAGASLVVGSEHTVTITCTMPYLGLTFAAYSGTLTTADPFDVQNGSGATTFSTSGQLGSVTPSQNTSLIVTIVTANTGSTCTVDSSYTVTDCRPWQSGVNEMAAQAYLVQTSATATNPTWSIVGGTSAIAAIAAFKPAAGGVTTARRRILN